MVSNHTTNTLYKDHLLVVKYAIESDVDREPSFNLLEVFLDDTNITELIGDFVFAEIEEQLLNELKN